MSTLVSCGETTVRSDADLGCAFVEAARRYGDRPALWCRGEQLTYSELLERAGTLAATIRDRNLAAPGDAVAILSERSTSLYVGILGALLAGCAYVPLNPRFPKARNQAILARSQARVLIADARHAIGEDAFGECVDPAIAILVPDGQVGPDVGPRLLFGHAAFQFCGDRLPCEDAAGELAYVFFTSGSTGEPKGVPIRHDSVFAYLRGIRTLASFDCDDRFLQLVDVTFDLSVHDMFLCWTSGACLFSVPENAVLLSTRFVAEHDITAWLSVPSTAGLIREAGLLEPRGMPSLRHTFFCGEALAGSVASAWMAAAPGSVVHNIYGPTEATIAISGFRCDADIVGGMAVVPLGEPFPEQRMGLFDQDGVPTDTGTIGEICLAGSQLTHGYLAAPSLTAARFFYHEAERWYKTGDLGRYDANRGFIYQGRTDHQIKIRGYRVELQEIEAVVRLAVSRDLVAVVPWPFNVDGGALGCVAFVTDLAEAETIVIARCAGCLPPYMVPARIIEIGDFPFNANGKVDYPALREHPLLRNPA